MKKELIKKLNKVFPPLRSDMRKGENGRVGVIGGSYQFTGAPYYSAISSLKSGGDLAHIFCSKISAPSIKSYSPEIITHPVFVSEQQMSVSDQQLEIMHEHWLQKINAWQKAINIWIIGPGLGRDRYMYQLFPKLIKNLTEGSLVLLDADGIYYLSQHPYLFEQLKKHKCFLTPNWKQFNLIQKAFNLQIDIEKILKQNKLQEKEQIRQIDYDASKIGVTLLIKGRYDLILGKKSFIVETEGGLKRCGGIGDILVGVLGTCAFWDIEYGPPLASRMVRLATRQAFLKQGRGLTAPSIIREIAQTVKYLGSDF